jgi:hypothetical protein
MHLSMAGVYRLPHGMEGQADYMFGLVYLRHFA